MSLGFSRDKLYLIPLLFYYYYYYYLLIYFGCAGS